MQSVRINGAEVTVIGVLKGLVKEEDKVAKAFADYRPDGVAISASKEELAALRAKETHSDYELSSLEEVYKVYMDHFGEVRLPTPAYLKAIELADEAHLPLIPIDMNDEEFTDIYCKRIRGVDMVREGFYTRSIKRRKYRIGSAEEFALDWDKKVNRAKGFRQLERDREEHMARTLRNMSSKYKSILAFVEYERSAGVERCLQPKIKT
jgi:pheromone shutdown protein TraB